MREKKLKHQGWLRDAALLEIAEFLKLEIEMGLTDYVPPRMMARFIAMRNKAYQALGDPSIADVEEIRRRATEANSAP
jgi:hypothetical protein